MFVPITFNVKYKEYPNAPKASRNSKIMGYVMSWPIVLLIGTQVWDMFTQIIIMNFDGEKYASAFIAGLITIIVYGLCIKFEALLTGIIDTQAVIEAHVNYSPEIAVMKSDARMKLMCAGAVCISAGAMFAGLETAALPHKAEDIMNFSGKALMSGKTYYADKLYVIGGYAKTDGTDHIYYVSAFSDKDGDIYLLSFDPGEKSEARRIIDENRPSELCKLSAYVTLSELESDLYGHYTNAVNMISDAEAVYMQAEYICSDGENFLLHSIGEKELFRFTIAVILVLLGLYMMKGAAMS